jgi:hypothetical protein
MSNQTPEEKTTDEDTEETPEEKTDEDTEETHTVRRASDASGAALVAMGQQLPTSPSAVPGGQHAPPRLSRQTNRRLEDEYSSDDDETFGTSSEEETTDPDSDSDSDSDEREATAKGG